MNNDERLREALLEIEVLRRREADRARESRAILSALEAMTQNRDASDGIEALLDSIRSSLECGLVALFDVEGENLLMRFPDSEAANSPAWTAPGLQSKRRRIVDMLSAPGLWAHIPEPLAVWRSFLSVPISEGARVMVMVAFSDQRAGFGPSDADLLRRLAQIASQAIFQRTLEQRSDFLSAVIDASPVSVAIADARDDLPLIYVNNAFTALTGYRADEVLGHNCRLLSAEDADADVRKAIRTTLVAQKDGNFLLRNRRKSGEIFWNELRLFPIQDEQGDVTQIVATQTDATQRVTAEMERDSARKRLEGALSATSEAFLIIGRSGTVRFVNSVFRHLFRIPDLEVGSFLRPDQLALLLSDPLLNGDIDPVSKLREQINKQIKLRTGRHVLLRTRPMDNGGAVIAATDITQTKVNDRILRQRIAAIEMSQDGIGIGDADGRILYANPSLISLWDLPDERHSLGRKWSSFYQQSANDKFHAESDVFLKEQVWRDEVVMPHPNGAQTHDVSISLVADVGTVLIVRDITQRQNETDERNRLRRQLDRAQMHEQLGQISAGLAHDFNNLLSAILGSAALIDTLEGTSQPALTAAQRIKTAAERAVELVDGFLDLGQRERHPERINLGDAVLTTVDLAEVSAPPQVQIVTSINPAPIWINASRTDLLQCVMNLVVNGIDALDDGLGRVKVTLGAPIQPSASTDFLIGTAIEGKRYATIEVADTGVGMPPEVVSSILEPYFTTKGNSGSGLGLAIVVSTLKANGCLLTLQSQANEGTTFTVYWPVDDVAAERNLNRPKSETVRKGLPILIVDDQEDVAATLGAELMAAGFEVAETTDPEAAIETVLEDPDSWGCVISDYDMPKINGGDLVERLLHDAPSVPVIVVSALARRLSDKRVDSAHAVLSKPFQMAKLIATLNSALNVGTQENDHADPTCR